MGAGWRHGAAKGAGWGGEAKGAGAGPAAPQFTADSPTRVSAADTNDDPEIQAYRQKRHVEANERTRVKRERSEALEDRLYKIAMGEVEGKEVQVSAGVKVHAIWNGLPVAKQEVVGDVNIRRVISERPMTEEEWLAAHSQAPDDAAG